MQHSNVMYILLVTFSFSFYFHFSSDDDLGIHSLNKDGRNDEEDSDDAGDSDIEPYYADYLDDDEVCKLL